MTWRYALLNESCGRCHKTVPQGELELVVEIAGAPTRVRCQPCGEQLTGNAAVVTDLPQAPPPGVPAGISHQPSLGFTPVAVVAARVVTKAQLRRGLR